MTKPKLPKYLKILYLFLIWLLFYLLVSALDKKYNFLPWGEIKLYEKLASDLTSGKIPYLDFYFEYPPASIIPFVLPKIIAPNLETYRRIFELMNLFLTFVTTCIGVKILQLVKPVKFKIIWIVQSIIFFILIQLVVTRYDVFPMFLTALGIYFYLYGDKYKKDIFKTLAYGVITLAGFVKLYPFVVLPILAIKELKNKEYKLLKNNIIACILMSLPFVILMYIGKDGVLWFLKYHGERGLEIESTYSSILLFLNQIGIIKDVSIVYTHASFGIAGNLPNLCAKLSFPLFLILYGLTMLLAFKQDWGNNVAKKIIHFSLITILLFVLTNKVFSVQYYLWFFPLLVNAAFLYKKRVKKVLIFIILLATVLTIVIYPLFWEVFNKGNLGLTSVLLLRNILLGIVLFLSYRLTYQK